MKRIFDKHKGGIIVPIKDKPNVTRPNKLAAGMSKTHDRQTHKRGWKSREPKPDVLRLLVYGTTAQSLGMMFKMTRGPCPCCGSRAAGKFRLTDQGRARLWALTEKRAKRVQPRSPER
jgi:hypothetical protein